MTVLDNPVLAGSSVEQLAKSRGLGSRGQIGLVQAIEVGFLAMALLLPSMTASDVVLLACVWLALAWAAAMRPRLNLSILDDLPRLFVLIAAAQGVTYWILAIVGTAPTARALFLSAALVLFAVVFGRFSGYMLVKGLRRSGTFCENAVVIGQGVYADFLLSRISGHPEFGLRAVGHLSLSEVALRDPDKLVARIGGIPNVRTVIVAQARLSDVEVVMAVRALVATGRSVYYVPRFPEFTSGRDASDSIWGMPLVKVRPPGGSFQRQAKRAFDLVVSGIALIILAPLMLVIGFAIKRETGGSVLFRQSRVGQGGQEFELLKFQTMVPVDETESQTQWNIASDTRLGKLGRFLRASSLDELPQLVNVLRGEMSLVGPRPERPHYVEQFSETYVHYAERHRAPVGLTGWAQIHRLRGDTSIDDRARFDNAYCDHWDLWDDAKILLKTVPEVIRHSGG